MNAKFENLFVRVYNRVNIVLVLLTFNRNRTAQFQCFSAISTAYNKCKKNSSVCYTCSANAMVPRSRSYRKRIHNTQNDDLLLVQHIKQW